MLPILPKYLTAFRKLKVDRSHGDPAPHKLVLLISILQAYRQNLITDQRIYITPDLVSLFKTNWTLLVKPDSRFKPVFALPFFHLRSSSFWKLIPRDGYVSSIRITESLSTFNTLNAMVDHALIAEDLAAVMKDPVTNERLLLELLNNYFPERKKQFLKLEGTKANYLMDLEKKLVAESPETYKAEIDQILKENNEEELFLRGSAFKREIPKIYNSTCCISGMRITATADISMVDACHIVSWSESHDDTISNGIALCPNLHRAFDRGLISINDHYQVIISKSFIEDDTGYGIRKFEGKTILLPGEAHLSPKRENLSWHRERVFRG